MKRLIDRQLREWKDSPRRKPLIVRGARQVGKTWSIMEFGREAFSDTVSINLEDDRAAHRAFGDNLDAGAMTAALENHLGRRIVPGKTLLFLDEIQAHPRAITALRYFYEGCPQLHVVAAGSLLEFAVGESSFPVGRVEFLEMYPMTFAEYLRGLGNERGAKTVSSTPERLPQQMHDILLGKLKQYCFVGGMPESVRTYAETGSLREAFDVTRQICLAYRQDFGKYARRADPACLDDVLLGVARSLGGSVNYTRLAEGRKRMTAKRAFDLLSRARVLRAVRAASAAGLPLAGSAGGKPKALMVDVGVWQSLSGMNFEIEHARGDLLDVYRGAMAEQFVGQELLAAGDGELFYWSRRSQGGQAEVDYLISMNGRIYGVEVKSGAAGRLRSLHQLLKDHPNVAGGLVFSSRPYETLPEQKLTFLPLYYAGQATSPPPS